MFISSPSKSALYGVVHERFIRNVLCDITRTRCAISDMRCSDGCRLKITQSPSRSCRSTVSPTSSAASAGHSAMFCLIPDLRTTNRAPRSASVPAPHTTRASSARLCSVTFSGNVRLFAMLSGTPTSPIPTYGSPVITVRAVKSVRFPIRFWRTRPCFPSIRFRSALIVFADDIDDRTNPTFGGCTSDPSMNVCRLYASSISVACVTIAGCFSLSCFCSSALRRTIAPSVAVRSSWFTTAGLSVTAGRTCGGTTATVVTTSCRGCVPTPNPSRAASSSAIAVSVAYIRSTETGVRTFPVSSANDHDPAPCFTTRGCSLSHRSHLRTSRHASRTAANRTPRDTGRRCARSTAPREFSVSSRRAHCQHTHERTASARRSAKWHGCITGTTRSTWPWCPKHACAACPHVWHRADRSMTPMRVSIGPFARATPPV
jgi:hypothetical protein